MALRPVWETALLPLADRIRVLAVAKLAIAFDETLGRISAADRYCGRLSHTRPDPRRADPFVEHTAGRLRARRPVPIFSGVPGRKVKLRRHDRCVSCGESLVAGTAAWWDREAQTVTCTPCWGTPDRESEPAPAALELGEPGATLTRQYECRKRNSEQRTREVHPRVGGLVLALRSVPQHESAFYQGAVAERAVANSVAMRTDPNQVITLHNRRMPRGRGAIDHLAVAPTGVWVIDTKDWAGKIELDSAWFGTARLLIQGRDRTKLIDGLERQIAAVRAALDRGGHRKIDVRGALCFTKANLPFLRTQNFRGHLLLYRKALAKRLNADGPLSPAAVEQIARHLATGLPPAR